MSSTEVEKEWDLPHHVEVAYHDVINEPENIKEHQVVKSITTCTRMVYNICQIGTYIFFQVNMK